MTDQQYAAMAADLVGRILKPHQTVWGEEITALKQAIATRLQSVAAASHKAGAEAMREKAAEPVEGAIVIYRASAEVLTENGNTEHAERYQSFVRVLERNVEAIRALPLPTGEQG